MMILIALTRVTALLVAAFFVLYFALKSEGRLKTFGRILGGWMLVLAAVMALAVVTAPLFGGRPFGMGPVRGPHGKMMMQRGERPGVRPESMETPTAPVKQATPPAN